MGVLSKFLKSLGAPKTKLAESTQALLQYFAIIGRDDIIRHTAESGRFTHVADILNAASIGVDENMPILSTEDAETISTLQQILVDNTECAYFTKEILGELARDLGFIGGGRAESLGVGDVRKFVKIYFDDIAGLDVKPTFFVNEKVIEPSTPKDPREKTAYDIALEAGHEAILTQTMRTRLIEQKQEFAEGQHFHQSILTNQNARHS